MTWRDKRNHERNLSKALQENHKPLPPANWKDYSGATASSAYSYENFAVADEPDGNGTLHSTHKTHPTGSAPNGKRRPNNGNSGNNGKQHGYGEKTLNGGHHYDDRAMPPLPLPPPHHRPPGHQNQTGGGGFERPRYGAPLQPDFYFMPHQRRYSGEVVRVFVDYNNPQYAPK